MAVTQKRKKPYTLEVVDGTLLSDKESGLITSETPLLDLTSKVLKVNHDHTWGVCRTPWMYGKVQCGRLDEPWRKWPSLGW